jgi:hypothetical protein
MENQNLQDEVEICQKETDNLIITVKTQILDEPNTIVVLVHQTIFNKVTHKSESKQIHREVFKK